MTVAAAFARRGAGLAAHTARSFISPSSCLFKSHRTPLINSLPSLVRYYADKSFPSHTVVSMPALSPTMTAGNIGTWQKSPGDSISPGDVLVEIETDKAQMDFEFQEEAVLAKILIDSGEKDVAVGSPIAVMVEDVNDVDAFKEFTIDDAGGKPAPPKPEEKQEEKKEEQPKEESKSPEPAPEAQESTSSGEKLVTSLERLDGLEFMASPKAKVLALSKGIPLKDVKGTGPGGRIRVADVEKFKGAGGGAAAPSPLATGPAPGAYEDIQLTGMRKNIATRLQGSMNTSPHFFISTSCSVSKLLKLRVAMNEAANGEYKLSVNDFLVKAVGLALLKNPKVNAAWLESEGVIRQYGSADISIAVATPVGLITPIVKSVQAKGLAAISSEIRALAGRARDGKLKPEEYQGGTFTISNMGMNDAVDHFTAIINPPQSGILAVGAVKKVAILGKESQMVEWDDQLVVTSSFDHRVVDGAVGAEFMKSLKKVIENPLDLML